MYRGGKKKRGKKKRTSSVLCGWYGRRKGKTSPPRPRRRVNVLGVQANQAVAVISLKKGGERSDGQLRCPRREEGKEEGLFGTSSMNTPSSLEGLPTASI